MVGRQGKASAGRLGVKYAFPFLSLSRGSSCWSVGRPAGGSKQLEEGWEGGSSMLDFGYPRSVVYFN